MNLDSLIALASDASDAELQAAWGTSPAATRARKTGKRPLTMSDLGALADLLGPAVLLDALHRPGEDVSRGNV